MLGIIIPYFEALISPKRRQNLNTCISALMEEQVDNWYLVECVFDKEICLPYYGEHHIRLYGDIMWQKERLINIGFRKLISEGCEYLMALDADIIFEKSGWSKKIIDAMQECAVIQNCSTFEQFFDDMHRVGDSAMKSYLDDGNVFLGRTGGSWTFSSKVIEKIPLYEYRIIGGGDTLLLYAAIEQKLARHSSASEARCCYHPEVDLLLDKWIMDFHAFTMENGGFGYIDQMITALPHGDFQQRAYRRRHDGMLQFRHHHVTAVEDEPFRWAVQNDVRCWVEEYLKRRS